MDITYDTLRLAGNALMFCAALIGAASVAVHLRVDWRGTAVGRHLLYYMLIIDAVLVLSCVRIFVGDSWWFALIRLGVFALVPVVMAQRLYLQVKAQRSNDEEGVP